MYLSPSITRSSHSPPIAKILFPRKLTCGIMANNPAMVRVFEKLGFRREATLRRQIPFEGDFLDHILLGCFAEEYDAKRTGP